VVLSEVSWSGPVEWSALPPSTFEPEPPPLPSLKHCERVRTARANADDAHAVRRWQMTCTAALGLLDEAVDLVTTGNDARLVKLSKVVDERCGSCD